MQRKYARQKWGKTVVVMLRWDKIYKASNYPSAQNVVSKLAETDERFGGVFELANSSILALDSAADTHSRANALRDPGRGTKETTGCIVREARLMRTVSRRRNDEGTKRKRAERKEELAARKKPKRGPSMGFKQPQIRISGYKKMTLLVRLARGHLLRDHGHRERKKNRTRRETRKFPVGKGKAVLYSTFIATQRDTSGYKQEVYIQWCRGKLAGEERKRRAASPREKRGRSRRWYRRTRAGFPALSVDDWPRR